MYHNFVSGHHDFLQKETEPNKSKQPNKSKPIKKVWIKENYCIFAQNTSKFRLELKDVNTYKFNKVAANQLKNIQTRLVPEHIYRKKIATKSPDLYVEQLMSENNTCKIKRKKYKDVRECLTNTLKEDFKEMAHFGEDPVYIKLIREQFASYNRDWDSPQRRRLFIKHICKTKISVKDRTETMLCPTQWNMQKKKSTLFGPDSAKKVFFYDMTTFNPNSNPKSSDKYKPNGGIGRGSQYERTDKRNNIHNQMCQFAHILDNEFKWVELLANPDWEDPTNPYKLDTKSNNVSWSPQHIKKFSTDNWTEHKKQFHKFLEAEKGIYDLGPIGGAANMLWIPTDIHYKGLDRATKGKQSAFDESSKEYLTFDCRGIMHTNIPEDELKRINCMLPNGTPIRIHPYWLDTSSKMKKANYKQFMENYRRKRWLQIRNMIYAFTYECTNPPKRKKTVESKESKESKEDESEDDSEDDSEDESEDESEDDYSSIFPLDLKGVGPQKFKKYEKLSPNDVRKECQLRGIRVSPGAHKKTCIGKLKEFKRLNALSNDELKEKYEEIHGKKPKYLRKKEIIKAIIND